MEQTPSSDTGSSQKSLPSSHDPGWNDPPGWALSTQLNSAGTSTKRLLNKRVAFPLSSQFSSAGKASPPPSSKTPPVLQSSTAPTITSAPHKPFVAPVDKNLPTTISGTNFDKDQALTEALTNLRNVMTEQKEKSKAEEIQRRLDVMKSDWLESKLNDTIQRSILDISKALLERDFGEADKIHVTLMMQHAAVCRAWIPAIRHIIFELKKDCENSISKLEHSQSPLLSVETQEK